LIYLFFFLLQLLEDFAIDARQTVRHMAENRRGSPTLRRIASALCTISCRIENSLLQYKSQARRQGYVHNSTAT
jgi:hypothetical protein